MMNHLRVVGLLVSTALLATGMAFVAAPAQAAPVTSGVTSTTSAVPTAVKSGKPKLRVHVEPVSTDWQWTGVLVKFTRGETLSISGGAAACGAVVSKLPTWISKVISLGCTLLAIQAGQIYARGNCLDVWVNYSATPGNFQIRSRNC